MFKFKFYKTDFTKNLTDNKNWNWKTNRTPIDGIDRIEI